MRISGQSILSSVAPNLMVNGADLLQFQGLLPVGHDRFRLLAPGRRVVDLGCWPGAWLQVAGKRVFRPAGPCTMLRWCVP